MLHIHRAARADVLADALAALLSDPPRDPFAPELVAVPTRGMERWLTQRMSASLGASAGGGDGVCANVSFPTPHRLVTEAVAVASGVDPERDPWLPEHATWPLLSVVDENLDQPWMSSVAAYLGADGDPLKRERRLSLVRHLAALFDRYALHRPEMLAAWAEGRDWVSEPQRLPDGVAWQARLWRALRARIGTPGPAERRARACEAIAERPELLELPSRIALFGLTRLPAGHLEVLRALASGRHVHLFLLHPSAALWDEIASAPPSGPRRAQDTTLGCVRNRLLGSWGRDAREMQLVLGTAAQDGDRDVAYAVPDDEAAATTLLARLQDDVRADRAAPGAPLDGGDDARRPLDPHDRSIVVHACHGRARQVEVLRDAIQHALADDETLEPRDVIVMCPDVETFAPLIEATFSSRERGADDHDGAPGTDLRVRLADRSLTQTNPVLGIVTQLLALVGERLTASQVLDLADRAPVRRRFGFDDDDLTRLRDWIVETGIRWGLDAEHRARYRLAAVRDGTWSAGVDRVLLGVTMTEDGRRLFGDVLPLDDVDSRSIELAGRFAELVERLGDALDALSAPHPLREWAQEISTAADALTATSDRERWQRAELRRILEEMVAEQGRRGSEGNPPSGGAELAPAEIRAHLAARLAGRPTRANFRTGHLTVCTLMPMRSVPHRVVCLLGLDDGAFPRRAPRDGDDLMLADPHVGERDPRSEDRQLLLDALLAATERLIITYTGNDERTNAELAPAVPVGELLDAVDATVRCADAPAIAASDRICVRHPLQPFDPRNFAARELDHARDAPWSFDAVALGGARALTGPRTAPAPFLSAPLAPLYEPVLELDHLARFAERPVREFLRRRLQITLRELEDEVDDGLPIELDNLQRWNVAQRLLEAVIAGESLRVAARAEKARGTLPPGTLGDRVIDGVREAVIAIATEAAKHTAPTGPRDPLDVSVGLADGRRLTGTVAGVGGHVLLSAAYSRVGARQRIGAWVRLLALSAAHPEEPFEAVTIGRAPRGDDVRVCRIPPLAEDPGARREMALAELECIVDLYDRGMREPLPIFPKTSAAWAEAAAAGADPVSAAEREWTSSWNRKWGWISREDEDLAHQLVLGGTRSLSELARIVPASDEAGDGWAQEEDSRVGRCARRLWDGLLKHEQVSTR